MAQELQEEIKEQQNEAVNVGVINSSKAPRLPRWTRQEIIVLIQGKRVAEKRVRRGRTVALTNGGSLEPKWATVSSYCKRHGVNRGPVQCRKRWSNLAGDFKKIKEWESQYQINKDGGESFWVMRNDLRRERKLPGFFDKEVYDILDGSAPLNSSSGPVDDDDDNNYNNNIIINNNNKDQEIEHNDDDDGYGNDENEGEAAAVVLFDSGRSAAVDDGLFSDFEQSHSVQDDVDVGRTPQKDQNRTPDHNNDAPSGVPMSIHAPTPISEKQYEPFTGEGGRAPGNNEKQPAANPEMGSTSHEGRKRRRLFTENDTEVDEEDRERDSLHNQLVNVLERNGRILTAQLEAHNINLKLDREERKDHATSLVAVLNKLADALGKIAEKL